MRPLRPLPFYEIDDLPYLDCLGHPVLGTLDVFLST
jgi:hypothetical protein